MAIPVALKGKTLALKMLTSFFVNIKSTLDFIQFIQYKQKIRTSSIEKSIDKKNAELWYDSEMNTFKIGIAAHDLCHEQKRENIVDNDLNFQIDNERISAVFNFSKSFFGWTMPHLSGEIDSETANFIIFDILNFQIDLKKAIPSSTKRQRCLIHKITSKLLFRPSNFFKLNHHYLEFEEIKSSNSGGALEFQLFDNIFVIYHYKNYLIIDNEHYIGDNYTEIVESILLAIAFTTGEYLHDDMYIIEFDDDNFKNVNKMHYIKRYKSENLYYGFFPSASLQRSVGFENGEILYLKQSQFEELVYTIHTQPAYKRGVSILTELHGTTTNGHTILLSVALETICELISCNNEKNVKPIKDKNISKNIIGDLNAVLEKYATQIDHSSVAILKKKIECINSPTNKDKLLYPFTLYGINLSENEKVAIEERNNILHGRGIQTNNHSDKYICHLLRFCVTSLLLKYTGYHGPILYHSTLEGLEQNINLTDYLIKII
jgi:hypothetical protein